MEPKMTHQEIMKFATENQEGMALISNAVTDYISARCLLFNGLFPGLVLGAQAIEKYLKGYIKFLDKEIDTRSINHGIKKAKGQLQSIQDFDLDKYDQFFERMEKHYLTRYPDNKNASTSMSTAEIDELDELIIYLNENLPIPKEVKFRSGLYASLFFDNGVPNSKSHWILKGNIPLNNIYSQLQSDYNNIISYLYPNMNNSLN